MFLHAFVHAGAAPLAGARRHRGDWRCVACPSFARAADWVSRCALQAPREDMIMCAAWNARTRLLCQIIVLEPAGAPRCCIRADKSGRIAHRLILPTWCPEHVRPAASIFTFGSLTVYVLVSDDIMNSQARPAYGIGMTIRRARCRFLGRRSIGRLPQCFIFDVRIEQLT
ncbi:hypothetical protein GGX14DRAFT_479058 [Mycena pura]|uniref:Uncharacterized protein n=1 Tax=Mycena pura TaxID=153505 RepID=A0AAD6UV50_9AGAR|nr:hypothetical protein GGX14DRAFT_479058 [Mycena pura]